MEIQNEIVKQNISKGKEETENSIPLVLTVEELAQLLRIGRNTAYELVRSGQIRSIRIGKCYRIPRDAVIDFLTKV